MEWSEDLGGIKLRISRDANSPEDIIVEFDVRDRDLLVKKPKLKIEVVTQRLKPKWQGLVLKGGNKDKKTAFNGELPIDTFRQTLELKNTPFFLIFRAKRSNHFVLQNSIIAAQQARNESLTHFRSHGRRRRVRLKSCNQRTCLTGPIIGRNYPMR